MVNKIQSLFKPDTRQSQPEGKYSSFSFQPAGWKKLGHVKWHVQLDLIYSQDVKYAQDQG